MMLQILAPPVHANVNCMPTPAGFRQCPPFAAVLRNIQNRIDQIDQLEVSHIDVPSLHRKIFFYLLVLLLRDLHIPNTPGEHILVELTFSGGFRLFLASNAGLFVMLMFSGFCQNPGFLAITLKASEGTV